MSKLTYRLALVVVLASPDWWGALFAYSNTDRSDLDQVGRNLKRKPSKNKIFLSYPGGLRLRAAARSKHR